MLSILIWTNAAYQYWNLKGYVINSDVVEYYAYLPATFIYHDLNLSFRDKAPEEVRSNLWALPSPINKRVLKCTCGLSMLYAPFFGLAHVFAKLSAYNANGYSPPYKMGLIISSIFYLIAGLYFMQKILALYFSDVVVAFTSILVVLGTNLFSYVSKDPAMEHVYGFFMLAAFIYYTIKWHQQPCFKCSLLLGLLLGLISLTRPTNILIVLFFIFWQINSLADVKKRGYFFLRNYYWIFLMCVLAFCIWIPQFLYWKQQTGQWLYFSYGTHERFFWGDPKIIKGLFSYRKGWLLYTPLMSFALVGIFFLRKRLRVFFLPVSLFVVLNIYILFSWWCWWYGGGFGMRAMIDSYALLAIPLAAFVNYILKAKKAVRITFIILLFLLAGFNQFQVQQYRYGAIHWDAMSKKAYWASFGRLYPVSNLNKLLVHPDYDKAQKGIR